nr:MAG TPA: hypothetical protein [Caudoviricetes sp.]
MVCVLHHRTALLSPPHHCSLLTCTVLNIEHCVFLITS